jgi:hypothetical protein
MSPEMSQFNQAESTSTVELDMAKMAKALEVLGGGVEKIPSEAAKLLMSKDVYGDEYDGIKKISQKY